MALQESSLPAPSLTSAMAERIKATPSSSGCEQPAARCHHFLRSTSVMRITVKAKLGAAFATVIVLSGITAWLGISSLGSLNTTTDALLAGPVERIPLARDLDMDLLLAILAEKNLLLAGTNSGERTGFDSELLKQREVLATGIDKLDALATAEGKRRLAA